MDFLPANIPFFIYVGFSELFYIIITIVIIMGCCFFKKIS